MNKIQSIRDRLIKCDEEYYNKSNPSLSDKEYDGLRDDLRKLSPNDSYFKSAGMTLPETTEWRKTKHIIKMGSLDKVNTKEEFIKWAKDKGITEIVLEDKLDGISLELIYKNGILTNAITRGDGIIGEDILSNVQQMKNVKKNLTNFNGSLRAEIFMLQDDFKKINDILLKSNQKPLKNPRNAASGIAKRYNGEFSEDLTLLYYNIEGFKFDTEEEKLSYIKNQLELPTCFYKKCTIEEACKIFEDYEDHLRYETPYDIDGLVAKANDLELQEKLGWTGITPKGQIAWKFGNAKAQTTINGVEWSMGTTNRISPVALLEPTDIGGVTIKRASLHNVDIFKALNLGKGDIVEISRRNEVIPNVEKVIKHVGKKFDIPLTCPICASVLEVEGKFLACPNEECKGLQVGNLYKYITNLEIMDIGEAIIELLYAAGKIKEPADFYKLTIKDFLDIEGMGEKSGKKIIDHLQEKLTIDLPTFIGCLNINAFSNSIAENLTNNGLDTLEKMQDASIDQLISIKGIEEKTAKRIIEGLKSKSVVIKNLLKYITIKEKEIVMKKKSANNRLNGASYCFTGGIEKCNASGERFTRPMMQNLVVENGGIVFDGVKQGLSFLVQADPTKNSSKTKKAIALGVSIIGEDEFFAMVE
jgi:DNA ligase (NAD+)